MARYVDGFIVPLPKKKLAAYRKMAALGCKVWTDHGALDYRECVGEQLDAPFGMPFPKQLKLKKGETVVFAWILYKSRAHRDKVNALAMQDRRLLAFMNKMPFDPARMLYGGFEVIVEA